MKTLLPLAFMVALAATPAAATARTLVSFEQSGGIAGVSVSVAVSTTGHVTGDVSGGHRTHPPRAAPPRHPRPPLAQAPRGRARPGASPPPGCLPPVGRHPRPPARLDDSQSPP